jgi:hypothetical protein
MLLAAGTAYGHSDTTLSVRSDGALTGLPPEYSPARLQLPPAGHHGDVVLTIKGKTLTMPDCIATLFTKSSRPHLHVSASWYHTRSRLPPYLFFRLPLQAPTEAGFYDGWTLLVDMTNLRLLRLEAVFAMPGGRDQNFRQIDIKTFCAPEAVEAE